MAAIYPLQALRYTAQAGGIAELATLPYDVIPPALEAEYKQRSPYNFAHLILPNLDYAGAAERLRQWRAAGVLAKGHVPAVFIYQQTFQAPGSAATLVRRGFIALGDTEQYGQTVFRHERTLSGPKEDRYQLLTHTRVQFDSIFMLFPDPEGDVTALLETSAEPEVAYTDHEGVFHELWSVEDAGFIARLQEAMRDRRLLIADGHHRYETALRMGQPKTLMTFVPLESPGLRSFATHRLVHSLPDFDAAQFLARLPAVAEGLNLESPAGATRIGIATSLGLHHCDIPSAPEALNVAVLQDEILAPHLGLTVERVTEGKHLRYVKRLDEALEEVRAGRVQIAFLLAGLPVEGVAKVSFAGEVLPQKSTFFYPKLGSGLVMYEIEE